MLGTVSSLFQVPCGDHYCNNHLFLRMLRGLQGEPLYAGHGEFTLSSFLLGPYCHHDHLNLRMLQGFVEDEPLHVRHGEMRSQLLVTSVTSL